jgi:hypothetical protein
MCLYSLGIVTLHWLTVDIIFRWNFGVESCFKRVRLLLCTNPVTFVRYCFRMSATVFPLSAGVIMMLLSSIFCLRFLMVFHFCLAYLLLNVLLFFITSGQVFVN